MPKETRPAPEHFTADPEDKERVLKALGVYAETQKIASGGDIDIEDEDAQTAFLENFLGPEPEEHE